MFDERCTKNEALMGELFYNCYGIKYSVEALIFEVEHLKTLLENVNDKNNTYLYSIVDYINEQYIERILKTSNELSIINDNNIEKVRQLSMQENDQTV